MIATRCFLLAFLIAAASLFSVAQEVPLQQVDRDTYTFSTEDLTLIQDFALDGPAYHLTSDPYQFTLTALTSNGSTDSTVAGIFKFLVNGVILELEFSRGKAVGSIQLEKAKKLHVQLEGTNVEKTLSILRISPWSAMVPILAFLLLTFIFRHSLARWWRKMTGSEK